MHRRSGDAVSSGALAIDVDGEIGRRVVIVGANRGESFEIFQLRHQLITGCVNILRHNTADGVGVLTLGLVGRADVDLQDRLRRQHSRDAGNRAERPLDLQSALIDRRPFFSRLEDHKHEALRSSGARCKPCESKELLNVWIGFEFFVYLLLIRPHLRRRRTLQGNEHPARETAVTNRQKREWQMAKEKPEPDDAGQ